jgi:hypothetical protein
MARTGEARNEVELRHLLVAEGFAPTEEHVNGPAMRKLLRARFREAAARK